MRQHNILLLNRIPNSNVIHQLNGILSYRHKKLMTPSAGFHSHNCEQQSTVETESISTTLAVNLYPLLGSWLARPS